MNKNIKLLVESIFNDNADKFNSEKEYMDDKPKTIGQLTQIINVLLSVNSNGVLNLNGIDVSDISDFNSLFDQENGNIKLNNSHIHTIDISHWNIDRIDPFMFFKCKKLISVRIPSTVKTICGRAFEYCQNLTTIQGLPDNKAIAYHAFASCPKLFI